MNRRLAKYSLPILLILASSVVFAQTKTMSLEACIQYALTNNLNIKDQGINIQRNELYLSQDKMDRYPTLNSSTSYNYNFGRSIDPFTNQFVNRSIQNNNFSLTTAVTLYNGNRISKTIDRSKNEVIRGEAELALVKNQISLSVADAYLQIIYAVKQLELITNQMASTQQLLERAKQLLDAGKTNKMEFLNLSAQLATDQVLKQNAEGNIRQSYVLLKQVLQYPNDEELLIEIPEMAKPLVLEKLPLNQLVDQALEALPEVELAELQLNTARLNVDIAQSGLYPRLSMYGNVNTIFSESRLKFTESHVETVNIGYVEATGDDVFARYQRYSSVTAPFGEQLSDNFGQSVGLSLSIPIYNNNQMRSNVSQSKLDVLQGENNVERVKMQLTSEIYSSYTAYENALANYTASKTSTAAQEENYKFLEQRYEAGLNTVIDMQIARTSWLSALNQQERAKFELIFAQTRLNFYQTGNIKLITE
ncbi:MAG: outer membrane protein [Bacteroidia bacterium]|jgi:outer membrane protein